MKKSTLQQICFVILIIGIILFFLWSKLVLLSLTLLIITDTVTTQFSSIRLKKILSRNVFNILKYTYYILLPLVLAIFIRTFFFDIYFVPSSSMEQTLFPNDYVLVDKVSYGAKVPKRIQEIPVIGSVFKSQGVLLSYDLYKPLKAFKQFKREDIVVFKSTEENDVFIIKRIIGLPSDTLKIIDSKVFINNTLLKEHDFYCYNYIDSISNGGKRIKTLSNKEFKNLDTKDQKTIFKNVREIPSKSSVLFPYPYSHEKKWTRDNYGELIIPKKGMAIILDNERFKIYKNIIQNFENENFEVFENETKIYTFKNNYYFMMGDNRHGSSDSRSFGFVPENYIQGKMIKVFSKRNFFN